VGIALKQSGLSRKDIWVTTKWSFPDSNPTDALHSSLQQLGLDYVDLYLIHGTWATNGDIKGKWKEMEGLQKAGLTKSIGISKSVHSVFMRFHTDDTAK
jgi:diketogulonate reductase-like aldo/keto reductase